MALASSGARTAGTGPGQPRTPQEVSMQAQALFRVTLNALTLASGTRPSNDR